MTKKKLHLHFPCKVLANTNFRSIPKRGINKILMLLSLQILTNSRILTPYRNMTENQLHLRFHAVLQLKLNFWSAAPPPATRSMVLINFVPRCLYFLSSCICLFFLFLLFSFFLLLLFLLFPTCQVRIARFYVSYFLRLLFLLLILLLLLLLLHSSARQILAAGSQLRVQDHSVLHRSSTPSFGWQCSPPALNRQLQMSRVSFHCIRVIHRLGTLRADLLEHIPQDKCLRGRTLLEGAKAKCLCEIPRSRFLTLIVLEDVEAQGFEEDEEEEDPHQFFTFGASKPSFLHFWSFQAFTSSLLELPSLHFFAFGPFKL